jgi:hypothetical protein
MSGKVEGTLVLDGLLEGRLPDDAEIEGGLEAWVQAVGKLGLAFSLEVAGRNFSLLADNRSVSAAGLGTQPEQVIARSLEECLKLLPPSHLGSVFSTIRSVEYRRGEEVQTLYAVRPNGSVEVRTRAVEAATVPGTTWSAFRRRRWRVLVGSAVAVPLLALSALVVDYASIVQDLTGATVPVSESVQIDDKAFAPYVRVDQIRPGRGRTVEVTLRRLEPFPKSDADLQKAWQAAQESLTRRLAVEALARGYARFEFFTTGPEFLGSVQARLSGLRDHETIRLILDVPGKRQLRGVVLST